MTQSFPKLNVLHIVDTLALGGAETMAVTICNGLAAGGCQVHLCATRAAGPLTKVISPDVKLLLLNRRSRFDLAALRRLSRYIRTNQIDIIHAHSTSLLTAVLAALPVRSVQVIWHIHYGSDPNQISKIANLTYQALLWRTTGTIIVSQVLERWARTRLHIHSESLWYLPNFVSLSSPDVVLALPGAAEARIVAVANFRPVKDHPTLLKAMQQVIRAVPSAHLLLVGVPVDSVYLAQVEQMIQTLGLGAHVTVLGQREDVAALLTNCAIGVLSSSHEGLPVSLLEYGAAALPVVVTDVGQCRAVLDDGRVGKLVPPASPEALAQALIALLLNPTEREVLGAAFHDRVRDHYSVLSTVAQLQAIYQSVINRRLVSA